MFTVYGSGTQRFGNSVSMRVIEYGSTLPRPTWRHTRTVSDLGPYFHNSRACSQEHILYMLPQLEIDPRPRQTGTGGRRAGMRLTEVLAHANDGMAMSHQLGSLDLKALLEA